MNEELFESRKKDHIRFSLQDESQSLAHRDWDRIRLIPEALPNLNFSEVSLAGESLGQVFRTPFFVSSMTGGHSESQSVNSVLAEACEKKGWLLGVGSQRRELIDQKASQEWREIRKQFPGVSLASNIGISQLIHSSTEAIQMLIENMEAKLLFVHLNPLQEVLQLEGTPQFQGGIEALQRVAQELSVPLVVKEVGCGISVETIQTLKSTGVRSIDISGRGGTHWGRVEGFRAPESSRQGQAAAVFKDWGLSTPRILRDLSEGIDHGMEIWASGGIRNGLQAAQCLAMGAQRVGIARPFLEKALQGVDAVLELMEQFEYELRISLFCLGMRNINQLKQRKVWVWEKE